MHRASVIEAITLSFLWCLTGRSATNAAEAVRDSAAGPRAAVAVWDTGAPSEEPLAPPALTKKEGWIQVQQKIASFKGDAVLSNGRILAVLRKHGPAVEVYSAGAGGTVGRLRLQLLTMAGEPADGLDRVAVVENTKGAASLEGSYKTAKGTVATAKFRLNRGDVSLQVEPGTGAGKLQVGCPGRFIVLPDFFADDITLDAAKLPLEAVEFPSENFVLHLTANGDAIAMCVFENRQQDVKVRLAGEGAQRLVTGSEIGFESKKVWVALLEAPQIWRVRDLRPADTGKVIPLEWKMPFPAQWRVDFTRSNHLTDSWEMLLQEQKGGKYTKPSWLGSGDQTLEADRKRWNTVLGTYPYPCWSDPDRHGFVQPLKSKVLQFAGPVVVYPINRVQQTPLVPPSRRAGGPGLAPVIVARESAQLERPFRRRLSADTMRSSNTA